MPDAVVTRMPRASIRPRGFGSAILSLLLGVTACGAGGAGSSDSSLGEPMRQLDSALTGSITDSLCNSATAGGGWLNTFMPQSDGTFSVEFNNYPSDHTLDAVIGLSNAPAGALTDMGPIVRFNPYGQIDARNGDHYEGAFPYTGGVGPFAVRMDVNLATRHYDVWVKHNDAGGKPFELLGSNFAFRTEQSDVTRLANVGRFVDSAQGNIETCSFKYSSPTACRSSEAGTWLSQVFPVQTGTLRLEFDATATSSAIDAVIGASNGVPSAFSELGPIVRFDPDGTLDARNGGAYASDVSLPYAAGVTYHIALDIDLGHASYSVSVSSGGQAPVVLARDYAFRSEQAQLASLDHLGQFVDGTPGSLSVCSLIVEY